MSGSGEHDFNTSAHVPPVPSSLVPQPLPIIFLQHTRPPRAGEGLRHHTTYEQPVLHALQDIAGLARVTERGLGGGWTDVCYLEPRHITHFRGQPAADC
ncbi:hypothetical protein BV20DRAFT_961790 [Pilatotrama ljubarskyi]|nr:hypothetical protein BV20DRAFT_961790 [Pilatotrama ljubarskyi]